MSMHVITKQVRKEMGGLASVRHDVLEDPQGCKFPGRDAHALTPNEDVAILCAKLACISIFTKNNIPETSYEIKHDAFGNLFVTYFGNDRSTCVMSGSHIDSVKKGGLQDGLAGTASGIGFLQLLAENKIEPECNFTFVAFRAEESSPATGRACLGSAIATGTITEEELRRIRYTQDGEPQCSLEEHITRRYGPEKWQAILDEIKNPPITKEKVRFYEEVHVAQSPTLLAGGFDLGIVAKGIGGAQRLKVHVPNRKMMVKFISPSPDDHLVLTKLRIIGTPNHTGGTPHNRLTDQQPIRPDALIGMKTLLTSLFPDAETEEDRISNLVSIQPEKETGYTTVPHDQVMEIVCDSRKIAILEKQLEIAAAALSSQRLTLVREADQKIDAQQIPALHPLQALHAVDIADQVERIASEINIADEALGAQGSQVQDGMVRGTVTDFTINTEKTEFKIDLRKADQAIGEKLQGEVTEFLSGRLRDWFRIDFKDAVTVVADNKPGPLDDEAVELKKRIAAELGHKFAVIPSIAGHDARSVADTGVPTAMTFLTDARFTHDPREYVSPAHFAKGLEVSYRLISHMLGVDWSQVSKVRPSKVG